MQFLHHIAQKFVDNVSPHFSKHIWKARERPTTVTKHITKGFSFIYSGGWVTELCDLKLHSVLGICHAVWAESIDMGMDAAHAEGGAELLKVPRDQSVCNADRSVPWSALHWLMSWQWTLEVWVIAFRYVIHGKRPVHWHLLMLWLSSKSCTIPLKCTEHPNSLETESLSYKNDAAAIADI